MAKELVCPSCGYVGSQRSYTKGSIWVELFLWLCLAIPGLIYSIWRLSSKYKGCPKCKNPGMIPADSPVGKKIISA
jgi:uncharacterized membrane protein YqaE (UPF0057 family)